MVAKISEIYATCFKAFAHIVDTLESKVASSDNISNWVTQLVGNGLFTHAMTITGKIAGQSLEISLPANFMPASSKGNSNAYMESARIADFGNSPIDDTALILLAYNIGWLLLGKPMSSVNIGRGLVIDSLFSTLKLTDIQVTIKDVSFGGDQPKHDVYANQKEILSYVTFESIRSIRLLALPNRSGKIHHTESASTIKIVKVIKNI